jgi:hypothetical protein
MDPLTWRSEFTIYNVTNTDYGDYECARIRPLSFR